MIMYPPVRFDANEWFIIATGILFWLAVFWLPRRFSLTTILTICLFNLFLGQMTDFIIGKPPLDYYYYNDTIKYEYFDLLLYLVPYPAFGYFINYIYHWLGYRGWRLAGYILAGALVTTGMEWISVRFFHVFTYTGWRLLYSFLVYILVFVLNLMVFRFARQYTEKYD
ncbi:MAG: hypothetical protein HPY50_12795 [Firmicutes bacterium]|nr:hypothetical protein [Bacillota bacterium]